MFETLENRTLRSVDLQGETLTITGTNAADAIVVNSVDASHVQVLINAVDQGSFYLPTGYGNESQIVIHGLAGNDTITVASAVKFDTVIYGEAGNDTISGGGGSDRIDGGIGNDSMMGNDGSDFFYNPTVITRLPSSDTDHFWGGFGQDFVSYQGRSTGVVVTLDGVANDGRATAVPGAASLEKDNVHTDVEGVLGSDNADYIVGNLFNNPLEGYGGNDTIYGSYGQDHIDGGSENDKLYGQDGDDMILGGYGSDSLDGGAGNDSLRGGMSTDTLVGGTGTDTADYQNHAAAIVVTLDGVQNDGYAGENEWIKSDVENVIGTQYDDTITGNNNANKLDGDSGNDTIYGLGGADTIFGGFGNDQIHGGSGNDSLDGGQDNDTLWGDAGIDTLLGGAGVNVLNQ